MESNLDTVNMRPYDSSGGKIEDVGVFKKSYISIALQTHNSLNYGLVFERPVPPFNFSETLYGLKK